MISDIYIPTITLLKKYYSETPFYEFVINEYPACVIDHLPKRMTFKSIEYIHDEVIEAFLEMLVIRNIPEIESLKNKGLELESGIYHIQILSDEDATRRTILGMEFVFQKLHESYSFISSYQYYLDEEEIRFFCKIHTFESNEEDTDDAFENLNDYTYLFESYFYEGVIPDCYADEVAKMLLIRGRV